ncbi:hypothetical protein ACFL0Z_01515 [Patescibacteria group bacterium]
METNQDTIDSKSGRARIWVQTIIAEAAFFIFLYYVQHLLKVEGNLWLHTMILWGLGNVAIGWCPFFSKQLISKKSR